MARCEKKLSNGGALAAACWSGDLPHEKNTNHNLFVSGSIIEALLYTNCCCRRKILQEAEEAVAAVL
jgi:hypothetical protein